MNIIFLQSVAGLMPASGVEGQLEKLAKEKPLEIGVCHGQGHNEKCCRQATGGYTSGEARHFALGQGRLLHDHDNLSGQQPGQLGSLPRLLEHNHLAWNSLREST